jgi:hypothetical protein
MAISDEKKDSIFLSPFKKYSFLLRFYPLRGAIIAGVDLSGILPVFQNDPLNNI